MEQTGIRPWLRTVPLRWSILVFVGLLLVLWGLNTPEGLLGKADAIGYAVCHRIELRSFHLGERPLPLCARCSGMYLGALVGLGYQSLVGRRKTGLPKWTVLAGLIAFVGAFAIDGGNSFIALLLERGILYTPSNTLRLFTGSGMGLVIASALFPAFNQTVWRDWLEEPAIGSFRSFLAMVLLAVFIDLLVLSGNPVILYPLALLSAGSVLFILTLLYSMVYLIITRQENKYVTFVELTLALVVGFGVSLLQIGIIDLFRFWLTGTWDGFHFG